MKTLWFLAAANKSNPTFSFPFVNYSTHCFKIFLDKQLSSWQLHRRWFQIICHKLKETKIFVLGNELLKSGTSAVLFTHLGVLTVTEVKNL